MIKKLSILFYLILFSCKYINAQNKTDSKEQELNKIINFFDKNTPWETVLDTSRIYAFAFKAIVKKDDKGKSKLISFSANDTIAFKLFPKYEILKSIDYGLFMKDRTETEFIFPVILDVWNEHWPKIEQNQLELVKSAFNCCENHDIENIIYFKPILLKMKLTF